MTGQLRWSRRVPFLETPIHPFVADGRVSYVGLGKPPFHQIVVEIDTATGFVRRQVAIPYPFEISIDLGAPAGDFPYSVGDAVVLQGRSLFVEGGKLVPGARTALIPADILVLPGDSD